MSFRNESRGELANAEPAFREGSGCVWPVWRLVGGSGLNEPPPEHRLPKETGPGETAHCLLPVSGVNLASDERDSSLPRPLTRPAAGLCGETQGEQQGCARLGWGCGRTPALPPGGSAPVCGSSWDRDRCERGSVRPARCPRPGSCSSSPWRVTWEGHPRSCVHHEPLSSGQSGLLPSSARGNF